MSDSDLDIGDEEQNEQEQKFTLATQYVVSKADVYEAKDMLDFYALYKQATEGTCGTPRPNVLQVRARSKWNAWKQLGEMSTSAAKQAYVDKLLKMEPNCLDSNTGIASGFGEGRGRGAQSGKVYGGGGGGGGRPSGWVVHSIESKPLEIAKTPWNQKTLFDHVKENNLMRLREQLQPKDLDLLDEQGMALLHWATDRNAIQIIEFLVESGANVNQRDGEKQTALHYAASCGHMEALRCLLSLSADMELRDADGQTCMDVAYDEQISLILQAEELRRTSSTAT